MFHDGLLYMTSTNWHHAHACVCMCVCVCVCVYLIIVEFTVFLNTTQIHFGGVSACTPTSVYIHMYIIHVLHML